MTKYERAKAWIKKNQDAIIVSGVVVCFVGLGVAVFKADMKRIERLNAELNNNVDQLNNWYLLQNELGHESHAIATELEKLAREALIRSA